MVRDACCALLKQGYYSFHELKIDLERLDLVLRSRKAHLQEKIRLLEASVYYTTTPSRQSPSKIEIKPYCAHSLKNTTGTRTTTVARGFAKGAARL